MASFFNVMQKYIISWQKHHCSGFNQLIIRGINIKQGLMKNKFCLLVFMKKNIVPLQPASETFFGKYSYIRKLSLSKMFFTERTFTFYSSDVAIF